MTGFGGNGWQTILADLAIILFMVTAHDLASREEVVPMSKTTDPKEEAKDANSDTMSVATADPVAIYRPAPGIISLSQWLSGQPSDGRQRLTIAVRHNGANFERQIAEGRTLAAEGEAAGFPVRLIVEEAESADLSVMLTYDSSAQMMAQ